MAEAPNFSSVIDHQNYSVLTTNAAGPMASGVGWGSIYLAIWNVSEF